MNQKVIIHYFLFMAIILGAFASMAQNDYGLTIISAACFGFGVMFLIEGFDKIKKHNILKIIELWALAILFTLFGFRALYFHFDYVEVVLVLTAATLIIIYTQKLFKKSAQLDKKNKRLKTLISIYYASLAGFLLSLIAGMIIPQMSEVLGVLSTLLLAIVVLGMVVSKNQLVNGEEVSVFSYLRKNVGQSAVLATGFLLISSYTALYLVKLAPPLYTSKLPHNYIELINAAESGQEKPVNGVYKYERYEQAYNKLIDKLELKDANQEQ